ncbi:MAG TPA: hypothetical protein VHC18_27640 [Amycolatopsis sp.]|nr:hypothetical protein [Amycolatopsis sp.]
MTSTQHEPVTVHAADAAPGLGESVDQQRERLLALRAQLVQERQRAISPAVGRALEMAEIYLFLGLGYVGYTDELLPASDADRAGRA